MSTKKESSTKKEIGISTYVQDMKVCTLYVLRKRGTMVATNFLRQAGECVRRNVPSQGEGTVHLNVKSKITKGNGYLLEYKGNFSFFGELIRKAFSYGEYFPQSSLMYLVPRARANQRNVERVKNVRYRKSL